MLNEKFKEAELLAKNIIKNNSVNYSRMGSIHKLHADSLRLQNQFIYAIEEYENILKEGMEGELTPEVLYWIGHVYFEMGKYDLAYQYFQRVYILYGNYEKMGKKVIYNEYLLFLDKSDSSNAIIMTYNEMKNLNLIDDSDEIKKFNHVFKKEKNNR